MLLSNTVIAAAALLAMTVAAMPTTVSELRSVSKRTVDGKSITRCDLRNVQLPTKYNGTNIPPPPTDAKLTHVLIGRGTQNYTCPAGATAPVAIGAVAALYDASCLASFRPSLLHEATNAALQVSSSYELVIAKVVGRLINERIVAGYHYFRDNTTPVFDLRVGHRDDIFVGKRDSGVPAPDVAVKGVNDEGEGAVDWLKLVAIDGSVNLKYMYRVNTAGGKPPATCEGQEAEFEVEYSAEYWAYT